MLSKLWRRRYIFLLGSLFGLLLVPTIDPESHFAEEFFLGIFTLILMSSLYVLQRKTRGFHVFLGLGILSFTLNIFSYTVPLKTLDTLAISVNILFILWVILSISHHVFNTQRVNINVLLESACIYLLLGIFFSFLYTAADDIVPNSFSGSLNTNVHGLQALFSSFLYYSFVTLTTLGYGDIIPVSPIARSISIIEAIIAQLFVTIFMARLVGLHLNHIPNLKNHD